MEKLIFKSITNDTKLSNMRFLKVPVELYTNTRFNNLNLNAVFIYSIFLNLAMNELNKENNKDKNEGVYIYYPISKIAKLLKISKPSAIKLLKELQESGLIEKKQTQLYNKIYIKNFNELDEIKMMLNKI